MLQKSSLQKMVVRLLLAGILLMVCTGVALAADVSFSPTSGSLITAGTPVSATITGVLASDPVSIAVTASGTTATSYGVPSFTMPFQVDGSTFTISGSNVNTISLSVAAPDGTHSVTNHALGTLLSGYTAQAGTYHNNGASITPTISGQPTSVTVTLAGNAHTPISGSTLTWDTTGATVGSTITITIAGQSATYTIVAPTPERDPNTVGGSGDGAPAAGPAAAQRGALQQQQQSTCNINRFCYLPPVRWAAERSRPAPSRVWPDLQPAGQVRFFRTGQRGNCDNGNLCKPGFSSPGSNSISIGCTGFTECSASIFNDGYLTGNYAGPGNAYYDSTDLICNRTFSGRFRTGDCSGY